MNQFLSLGKGAFSFSFLISIVAICLVIVGITYVIRIILKRKLDKEIKLANIIHEELTQELFSGKWEKLKQMTLSNQRIAQLVQQEELEKIFVQLSETLQVSHVLISEFNESKQNGMSLREANTTMSFINSIIDANDEDISEFNEKVEHLLIQTGYSNELFKKDEPTLIRRVEAIPKDEDLIEKEKHSERDNKERQTVETKDNNVRYEDGECSIFASGLSIQGDVKSIAALIIKGEVNGNVESQNHIELSEDAKVVGNVSAADLTLEDGSITGDVRINNGVHIGEGTYIKGSVYGNSINIEGSIEGNVIASGEVSFSKSAKVLGDISASLIDVEKGAKISGRFNIGEDVKGQD